MLKIIWYSTVPYSSVGYGNATREILRRFRKDGHYVKIATKHALGGQVEVDGVECFDGEVGLINIIRQEENYDYIISMCDDWVFPPDFKFNRWVNCCFLDTHSMHSRMLNNCNKALHTVAVTKFTQHELEINGRKSWYAPLGVTTSSFKPDFNKRKAFRDSRGWTDNMFAIGTVGLNYGTDRKNFLGLLRAFKIFHAKHPDSILYLHTDVMGSATNGLPLMWVIENLGFKNDGTGPVQYVLQKPYHLWALSEEAMVQTYNAFDVFVLPTHGEGFGMPIVEAQACGVPVITTDTTSGRELTKSGWLIDVDESDLEFSSHLTWYAKVQANKIVAKLEEAYEAWKSGKIKEMGIKAREEIICYDWDIVYRDYWKPIFDYLDLENQGKRFNIPIYPNYKALYDGFGQLYQIGNCENFEHHKACLDMKMPRLPNEPEDDPRPLLIRSYPLFPDASGEMYVHTKCPVHKFMPPRFVKQCTRIWEEVLTYPIVRNALQKIWEERVTDNPEYVKLSEITTVFDEDYSAFLQKFFHTTFKIGPVLGDIIKENTSFVDIGCGDGFILKQLKYLFPEAVVKGTEINPTWIESDSVVYGDVTKLPFADGEFEVVFSVDVLEHIPDIRKALSELFRVAKKKLVLCVTPLDDLCFEEDPTHVVKWTGEQWKRELNELGNIVAIGPDNTMCTFVIEKRGG